MLECGSAEIEQKSSRRVLQMHRKTDTKIYGIGPKYRAAELPTKIKQRKKETSRVTVSERTCTFRKRKIEQKKHISESVFEGGKRAVWSRNERERLRLTNLLSLRISGYKTVFFSDDEYLLSASQYFSKKIMQVALLGKAYLLKDFEGVQTSSLSNDNC